MDFGLDYQPVPSRKFLREFEKTLYFEILKSQRLSSLVILGVALFLALTWTVIDFFFSKQIDVGLNLQLPARLIVKFLYGLALYELIYFLILTSFIHNKRKILPFIKYIDSLIEILFVTLAILVVGTSIKQPFAIFCSPAFALYFIFISISALKLDPRLSIFSGCLASVGYLFVFFYLRIHVQNINSMAYDSTVLGIGRAAPLMLLGLLIGFIAKELKKSIELSLKNMGARNAVISMFGQYVSPIVVDKLIHQPAEMPPELRHVCILFFDIRNFTSFADKHSAEEVIALLNLIFDACIDIINEHQGFINKFLGDGFMAVFGAPIPDGKDCAHATEAASTILKNIQVMNENKKLPNIRVGMGLHAGPALTGSVGSEDRKEYTVIGDTVNVASRVEQLNKEFHSQLIVSESVFKSLPKIYTPLQTHQVLVRGKEDLMNVYVLA